MFIPGRMSAQVPFNMTITGKGVSFDFFEASDWSVESFLTLSLVETVNSLTTTVHRMHDDFLQNNTCCYFLAMGQSKF